MSVIEERSASAAGPGAALGAGARCRVVEKVVGYKKIKFHTHENVGYGDVRLPEMQMHTTRFWLTVPETVVRSMTRRGPRSSTRCAGSRNALQTVACVGLMIDPRDLGKTLGSKDDADGPPRKDGAVGFDPTIFLYDNVPGGVGLARAALRSARGAAVARAAAAGGVPV